MKMLDFLLPGPALAREGFKAAGSDGLAKWFGPEATAMKAATLAAAVAAPSIAAAAGTAGGAAGTAGGAAGTAGGSAGTAGGFMGSLGGFGKQAGKYVAQSAIQNAFSPQPSQPIMPASNQRITPEFVDYYRKNNMNQRRFL